ncbi:MAG: putative glutamyl-tRNA(Gln) amidotransferase [Actinomycetia bacterium]|nr:putative glutamyl-tRNA(Gln) amidotransferase [Actinomycetes bacterium]
MTSQTVASSDTKPLTPTEKVYDAYAAIDASSRPEVWILLRPISDVLADAAAVEERISVGEDLPLSGMLVAVKDNIDVRGLPTTAGCPEFAYHPVRTATAVQRLVDQGAIILGQTNLDQFATGLVGTRSPYGAVRCAWDGEKVSGGSSSGSAVAVALGIADIGIGTDTAGSGRVPAAFHNLVGIKTTLGIVPTSGVVPACADFDCVTVFARTLALASSAIAVMAGPDDSNPRSREWPAAIPFSASVSPTVGVPRPEDLQALSPDYADAFARTVAHATAAGIATVTVDISELLDAAQILYDGAIVAERYNAVGAFLEVAPAGTDPIVASIIKAAKTPTGHEFAKDLDRLLRVKKSAAAMLQGLDGLLLPTTTEHPSIAAVNAEPISINKRLGTYTNFCNLLDMAAVAVPGESTRNGDPFGVMFVVPAFADQVAIDLSARLLAVQSTLIISGGVDLAVFGAHLRGQPLHYQLETLGARFISPITTSQSYRLLALQTVPPKPGLVRCAGPDGAAIHGELYRLSPAAIGAFLAALPAPMALTSVELSDGRWTTGFGCSQDAAQDGTDITQHRSWTAYMNTKVGTTPQHPNSATSES